MDPLPPDLAPFDLFVAFPERIKISLFANDLQPSGTPGIADFIEAAFAGYAPSDTHAWSENLTPSSPGVVLRQTSVPWTVEAPAAPGLKVYGWFATWEPSPGVPALFAFDKFATPQPLDVGHTLLARIEVRLDRGDGGLSPLGYVATDAFVFLAEEATMKFRGDDRKLLQGAKQLLAAIARHDGEVVSLPARSRRAPIQVIPTGDTELVNAYNAIKDRVDSLLAM